MTTRRLLGAVLGSMTVAAVFATNAAAAYAAGAAASSCSISPNRVALDQVWKVSASKLPTRSSTNLIITFPDGSQSINSISVASDGTYTTTGNSNMSANWGFITPEQTGTYDYKFVGKMKWPGGTYSATYADCTVVVS